MLSIYRQRHKHRTYLKWSDPESVSRVSWQAKYIGSDTLNINEKIWFSLVSKFWLCFGLRQKWEIENKTEFDLNFSSQTKSEFEIWMICESQI